MKQEPKDDSVGTSEGNDTLSNFTSKLRQEGRPSASENSGDRNENEITGMISSWMVPTALLQGNEAVTVKEIIFEPPTLSGGVPPVVVEPKDGSFRGERKLPNLGDLIQDIPFLPPGFDEPTTVVPNDGSFRGERKLPKSMDPEEDMIIAPENSILAVPNTSIDSVNANFVDRERSYNRPESNLPIDFAHSGRKLQTGAIPRGESGAESPTKVLDSALPEITVTPDKEAMDMPTSPPAKQGSIMDAKAEDRSMSPSKNFPTDRNIISSLCGSALNVAAPTRRGSFYEGRPAVVETHVGRADTNVVPDDSAMAPSPPSKQESSIRRVLGVSGVYAHSPTFQQGAFNFGTEEREINFSPGGCGMETSAPPSKGSYIEGRPKSPIKGPQREINVLPEIIGKAMLSSPPPKQGSFRGQIRLTGTNRGGIFPDETSTEQNEKMQAKAESGDENKDNAADDDPMAEDQDLWKSKKRWGVARQRQAEKAEAFISGDEQSSPLSTGNSVLASSIQTLGSLMGSSYQEGEIKPVGSQEEATDLRQSIQKLGSLLSSLQEKSVDNTGVVKSVEDDLLDSLLGHEDPEGELIVESLSAIEENLTRQKIAEDDSTVHWGNTTRRDGLARGVSLSTSSFATEESHEEMQQKLPRKQTDPKLQRATEELARTSCMPQIQGKQKLKTGTALPVKLHRKPVVPRFRTASGSQSFMAATPAAWKRSGTVRRGTMMSKFASWTQGGSERKEKSTAAGWEQQALYPKAQRLVEKRSRTQDEDSYLSDGDVDTMHNMPRRSAQLQTPVTPRFEIVGRPSPRHHPSFFALSPLASSSTASLSSLCSVAHFQSPRRDGSKGCQKSFDPYLHPSRGPCELCVFFLSAKEREQLDTTGRHLSVMFTTGGCCRSCEIFPRSFDDQPARLCRMCYQNSHRKVYQVYSSKLSRRVRRVSSSCTPDHDDEHYDWGSAGDD